MFTKKVKRIPTIIFVFSLLLGACRKDKSIIQSDNSRATVYFKKEGELEIFNGDSILKKLDVEFALTKDERQQGLMWRDSMKDSESMLFVFSDENVRPQTFWMRNTRIPLDIIYLSPDTVVLNIAKNAQPFQERGIPGAISDSKFVLEVVGGLSDEWGVAPGETKMRWKQMPQQ